MARKASTKKVEEKEVKVEAVKEEVSVKAEEAAEVKKEETEKAEPVKKRKYTRRATADTAKKTEKKAAKPKAEMVVETYIQYQNCEVNHADIVEKIKAQYVSEGHRVSSIKSLKMYFKPEERRVYYVINNQAAGSVGLF